LLLRRMVRSQLGTKARPPPTLWPEILIDLALEAKVCSAANSYELPWLMVSQQQCPRFTLEVTWSNDLNRGYAGSCIGMTRTGCTRCCWIDCWASWFKMQPGSDSARSPKYAYARALQPPHTFLYSQLPQTPLKFSRSRIFLKVGWFCQTSRKSSRRILPTFNGMNTQGSMSPLGSRAQ